MFQISLRTHVAAFLTCTSIVRNRKTFNHMLNPLFRVPILFVPICFLFFNLTLRAQSPHDPDPSGLPEWTKDVGARNLPTAERTFIVDSVGKGTTNSTKAIQKKIDECAKAGGGIVAF